MSKGCRAGLRSARGWTSMPRPGAAVGHALGKPCGIRQGRLAEINGALLIGHGLRFSADDSCWLRVPFVFS
jgi:hypothetical protein